MEKENEKEKQMRQELINYIKANDNHYSDKNFDRYSTTSLVILKTEIELGLLDTSSENNKG